MALKRFISGALASIVYLSVFQAYGQEKFEGYSAEVTASYQTAIDAADHLSQQLDNENVMFYTNMNGKEFSYSTQASHLNKRFEIGSETKMITAAAIFQLAAAGKLKLSDPIKDYLSPAVNSALNIAGVDYSNATILQVLGHQSGLSDALNAFAKDELALAFFAQYPAEHQFTIAQMLQIALKQNKKHFTPIGSEHYYSNIGYSLLGDIIKSASGEASYKSYVRKFIFAPLGMTSSGFIDDNLPNVLPTYFKLQDGSFKAVSMPESVAGSAGNVVSTLKDMKTFIIAMNTPGQLIKKNYIDLSYKMSQEYVYGGPLMASYYGKETQGFYGHNGQTFGSLSDAYYNPNTKTFYVSNVNNSQAGRGFYAFSKAVFSLYSHKGK